jgi:ATP-dependent DNA helicase RecG
MDISIIGELPPGRIPVKTHCVNSTYRERIHGFIKKETGQGRQAYVICPAIGLLDEGAETKEDMANVMRYTRDLMNALPGVRIACLHGRLKSAEKQQTMDDFKANRIQVIVSTTVIEVGVHVANATVMVIENAERFGLAQLHQLRGRVGRGGAQSWCTPWRPVRNRRRVCHRGTGFDDARRGRIVGQPAVRLDTLLFCGLCDASRSVQTCGAECLGISRIGC